MIERVHLLAVPCHATIPLPCEGGACRHHHALNSQDLKTACACLERRTLVHDRTASLLAVTYHAETYAP